MTIPQAVIDLLMEREGWRTKVYVDTTGNATTGMGHKMLPSELHEFPNGTIVPDETLEDWKESDMSGAYVAGLSQARQIGWENQRLINALTCVSFQLGAYWYRKPRGLWGTWDLLIAHQWAAAAAHEEISLWAKQTPVRAKDFADVLISLDKPAAPAAQA